MNVVYQEVKGYLLIGNSQQNILECRHRRIVTRVTKRRFSHSYDHGTNTRYDLRFSLFTVFSATSAKSFLFFSAYSRDAKEEIVTCIRVERIRILKCICMSYFYMFYTLWLTFKFSVYNSIINLYEAHYSCKKDPQPYPLQQQ